MVQVAKETEIARVAVVALVARGASVEEVTSVVSVVANDKENQLKRASHDP